MNDILKLKDEVRLELENNILSFWIEKMTDIEHGGFYGRIDGDDQLHEQAPKGAILHARILWTFSAAFRLLKKPAYLKTAKRAKEYLIEKFYDQENGGIYWEVDYLGNPTQTKKQIYALGFAIYGLSEYHRATGDQEALDYAVKLFETIEEHSFDLEFNGYMEAFTRNWELIEDMRLSDKDENEKKTMNTHLHILEPYTNLYRVWKDDRLKKKLENLIELFIGPILNKNTGHLLLFFDEHWNAKSTAFSFGHDIEASWLIHEAALVLGDEALLARVNKQIYRIADAASEGLMENGGLIYEYFPETRETDAEFHWWVQAENVVGNVNLYQHFNDQVALERAVKGWEFIKQHLIDHRHGEWFWGSYLDHTTNRQDDKAGFWKCPYHNGRMCMEIIERYS